MTKEIRYQCKTNRALKCRELVDTSTGAIIQFADFDQPAQLSQLQMRCDQLNAQHEATAR